MNKVNIIAQGSITMRGQRRILTVPQIQSKDAVLVTPMKTGDYHISILPGVGVRFINKNPTGKRVKFQYQVIEL